MSCITFYICFGSVFYAIYAPWYGILGKDSMKISGEFNFMVMCVLLWPMVVILTVRMEIELYFYMKKFKKELTTKHPVK